MHIPSLLYPHRADLSMNRNTIFSLEHILFERLLEGGVQMSGSNDQAQDVDDLIFDGEEWAPSDR